MKKTLFIFTACALAMSAVSCEKIGGGNDKPQAAEIEVILPDDLEEFDLDFANQETTLEFEWEASAPEAQYSLVFSLAEELTEPQTVEVGTEMTKTLTHADLDKLLADLGVGEYKRGELYWAVEADNNGVKSTSEVRSMKLFRFYKPFVDPRDGETYKVCKVVDPMTGDYAVWMAENFRASKFPDGTEITRAGVRFYEGKEGETPEETAARKRAFGGYYTWNAMVNGNVAAEEGAKLQGIAPKGWHVPTKGEWDFLINALPNNERPGEILKTKDSRFWDPTSTVPGTDEIGFAAPGAGYIWDPVDSENLISETFKHAYYWIGSAWTEDMIIPWNPAFDPACALTYGIAADDYGIALYPYHKLRGFNVRLVLD